MLLPKTTKTGQRSPIVGGNGSDSASDASETARHNELYGLYGRPWLWAAMAYGTQHLFSSYSLLSLAVARPFMSKTALQNMNLGIIQENLVHVLLRQAYFTGQTFLTLN